MTCPMEWLPNLDADVRQCAEQYASWYLERRWLPEDFHQTLCMLAAMDCQVHKASGSTNGLPPANGGGSADIGLILGLAAAVAVGVGVVVLAQRSERGG